MLLDERHDPLFGSRAVRAAEGSLSFVYKAAAEIGELGDNTAALRDCDPRRRLLHLAVGSDRPAAVVLAHTRWASVGIISEPNAHPLNGDEGAATDRPYVVAALNGDVDNFADLAATRAARAPGRDHDRRQGDPGARRPPARRRGRARRGVPVDGGIARGLGGDRRRSRGRARPRPPRAARAAARRSTSVSPRTPTSWPASPTAWSRRPACTCGWTARRRPTRRTPSATRGQIVVLDAAAAGDARRTSPLRLRRHAAAGRPRASCSRPRSRPATSTVASSRTSC